MIKRFCDICGEPALDLDAIQLITTTKTYGLNGTKTVGLRGEFNNSNDYFEANGNDLCRACVLTMFRDLVAKVEAELKADPKKP